MKSKIDAKQNPLPRVSGTSPWPSVDLVRCLAFACPLETRPPPTDLAHLRTLDVGCSRLDVGCFPSYTLSREKHVEVDGKYADAVLGRFGKDSAQFIAALEGKSTRDPLERPFEGRRMSAVDRI